MSRTRAIRVLRPDHTYLEFRVELCLAELVELVKRISGWVSVTHGDGSVSRFLNGVHQRQIHKGGTSHA